MTTTTTNNNSNNNSSNNVTELCDQAIYTSGRFCCLVNQKARNPPGIVAFPSCYNHCCHDDSEV